MVKYPLSAPSSIITGVSDGKAIWHTYGEELKDHRAIFDINVDNEASDCTAANHVSESFPTFLLRV